MATAQDKMNAAAYGTVSPYVDAATDWLSEKYDDAGQFTWDSINPLLAGFRNINSGLVSGVEKTGQGAQDAYNYATQAYDGSLKNRRAHDRGYKDSAEWQHQIDLDKDMATEASAIKRMLGDRYARRAANIPNELGNFAPQGVNRPVAQSYGSESMHNYNQPVSEQPASVDKIKTPLTAEQQITTARKNAQTGEVPGLSVPKEYLNPKDFESTGPQLQHPYGNSSPTSAGRQAYDNANYRLGINSPEAQRNVINYNRQKAAQGKLRIGSADGEQFGYKDMSPEAYRSMELERMGIGAINKPKPLTQSQQYYADLKGKALPVRDNRSRYNINDIPTATPGTSTQYNNPAPSTQTKALGTNVQDPLGRQNNSDFNQTSGTQALNNGNINNPKSMNNPNANRGNGFWN